MISFSLTQYQEASSTTCSVISADCPQYALPLCYPVPGSLKRLIVQYTKTITHRLPPAHEKSSWSQTKSSDTQSLNSQLIKKQTNKQIKDFSVSDYASCSSTSPCSSSGERTGQWIFVAVLENKFFEFSICLILFANGLMTFRPFLGSTLYATGLSLMGNTAQQGCVCVS